MKTYEILKDGHELLGKKCSQVEKFKDVDLRDQVNRMFETMDKFNGIGLAANQVGLLNRVLVVNTRKMLDENKKPVAGGWRGVMINPTVEFLNDELIADEEGCLSFPGVRLSVRRTLAINVSWQNLDGYIQEKEFFGITARCILHEFDHLNGITFRQRV